MITIGVDFHKRTSTYQVLNEQGQPLKRCKLENDTETIRDFIRSFTQPKRLAMEATRSWGLFYETTKDLVEQFHLGHPKKMVALTAAEIKNDKVTEVMTKPIKVLQNEMIVNVTKLMVEHHLNDLPIVNDEDRLVGELNGLDILKASKNYWE